MKINFKLFFILVGLTVIFSSCRTSAPRLEIRKEGPTVQAWFIKSIGKYIVSKCHETQKN